MYLIIDLIKILIVAWSRGSRPMKASIIIAGIGIIIATAGLILSKILWEVQSVFEGISIAFASISFAIICFIVAYQQSVQIVEDDAKVDEAEKRVIENPNQPKAAWDLARLKLESYLNRNLNQVRSIFWLTTLVMIVGFCLIGFGVIKAFDNPTQLTPSILSAVSGLLVNFIGATFLVLYKSTMEQAKEYVSILERINAVGMSVQVLDKIEDTNNELKNKTVSELSKQLLAMYAEIKKSP